jgi:hypothetical protein
MVQAAYWARKVAARRGVRHIRPMRSAILAGVLAALAGAARLQAASRPVEHGFCGPAIAAAETAARTAPGLLAAIGLVESGRIDHRTGVRQPWPWTVNAEGAGTYYPGKAEAILAVQALQARGVASIDIGCMQVNLMYHPGAFRTLDEAFDPAPNAAYAARFLSSLHARTGAWPAAAAAYHSFTPERGAQYAKLIANVWAGAPVPATASPSGAEVVSFPDGGQLRIFRDAAAPGRTTGRVLGYLSGP